MTALLASELPPPQRLALAYAPARARPATLALLALDARLAAILRGRREPLAAQLRLAWWREMFARPPSDWPAGEPLLEALRGWRDPSGLAALASPQFRHSGPVRRIGAQSVKRGAQGVGASLRNSPSCFSSCQSAAGISCRIRSRLARTCSGLKAPGMTAATSG